MRQDTTGLILNNDMFDLEKSKSKGSAVSYALLGEIYLASFVSRSCPASSRIAYAIDEKEELTCINARKVSLCMLPVFRLLDLFCRKRSFSF